MSGDPLLSEPALCRFVTGEAALLDEGRWEQWLELFTEDGRYWVPLLGRHQEDAHSYNSIAYEDRLLLALRIRRLRDPRAHSQHPPSHCQHVLQIPRVESLDAEAGAAVLRTPSCMSRREARTSWCSPAAIAMS
ncbi:aromatic-ring-hydroxylating dioxygenase subunit beta [Ottowia sp. VDI28]|uniref:aromatic-ring-hydroxylating dioxygenase subunit beta n=1 Tax=Ottowia sp. VDI28 TaxID=3133968 RepID=UPI003C2E2E24